MRKKGIVFPIVVALAVVLGFCLPAGAKDFLYIPGADHVSIVDCTTDTVVKTLRFQGYVIGCTPSMDGKRFYFTDWRSVYVVDTTADEIVDRFDFWSDLNRVSVMASPAPSADDNYLYMNWMVTKKKLNVPRLNVMPAQFVVYDLKKKQVARSFDVPYCSTGIVSLKDDPDHVILMSQDVLKLNVKDGKWTKIYGQLRPDEGKPGLNNLVIWNQWSPTADSGIFPTPAYGTDGTLQYMLIDRRNGSLRMVKGEDVAAFYSCILSPDGKYVYGVMDEIYKVDLSTGKTVAMDVMERGTTYALAISSDGKKLYAGPAGPDVSVYDTATMKRIGFIPLKHDGIQMSRISK
jgi:hypothetical protein